MCREHVRFSNRKRRDFRARSKRARTRYDGRRPGSFVVVPFTGGGHGGPGPAGQRTRLFRGESRAVCHERAPSGFGAGHGVPEGRQRTSSARFRSMKAPPARTYERGVVRAHVKPTHIVHGVTRGPSNRRSCRSERQRIAALTLTRSKQRELRGPEAPRTDTAMHDVRRTRARVVTFGPPSQRAR